MAELRPIIAVTAMALLGFVPILFATIWFFVPSPWMWVAGVVSLLTGAALFAGLWLTKKPRPKA